MHFIKEIIGIISIIVFIVFIEIITDNITNNSLSILNNNIDTIEKQENKEKRKDEIEKLYSNWENEESKLSCYMEHNELEEISKCVNALVFESKEGTKENIDDELNKMRFKMKHIKNKQKIKFKNIF